MQFAIGVALLLGVALVVFLLAFAQADLALDQVLLPVDRQGHAGVALLLHGAGQLLQLATVEQQLADLSTKHAEAESRALRADIASTYGISKEDRDLFLTGSDEAALTAQAKRLADRVADQKKNGNRAPREGDTTTGADKNKDMREFTRDLFGSAQND